MGLSWEAQKALEEAEEASDRSRYVVIAMLVASVLVFMAAWNSRWYGWQHLRLQKAQGDEVDLKVGDWKEMAPGRQVGVIPTVTERDVKARHSSAYADILQRTFTERVRFVSVPTLGVGFDA